jgi:ribosomal-protein-alanine acetyltransferase
LEENHEELFRFGLYQLRNRYSVRVMTAQDIDDVRTLAARFIEAPRWSRHDYEQILLPAPPSIPPASLTRRAFIALSDGALAGFAMASWLTQETEAELEGLVVDEKHRRQGIGSALITACREWAAKAGASSMLLEVRASNEAALSLYRRQGFSVVGRRRAYYSAPVEDAVLLQAPLGAQNTTERSQPL